MKFLMKEIPLDGSAHTRMWLVDIDQGEDMHYQSRVSFNAFMFSKHKRNQTDKFLYYGQSLEEAEMTSDSMKKFGSIGYDFTKIEKVDSIWDFYKIIGYDYKSKKFID